MNVVKSKKNLFKIIKEFKVVMLITLAFATFSCGNDDDGPTEPTIIEVSTLAGSSAGYADGSGSDAKFDYPTGVDVDVAGNLYVADFHNNKIRKITSDGVVTTIAGSTQGDQDGTGIEAKFNSPIAVAVDNSGNVYVADLGNHKIRKISTEGVVTTLAGSTAGYADGYGIHAKFNQVNGITVDNSGNVYVSDKENRKVRKITPEGLVTTLAGSVAGFADGQGSNAQFNLLRGITVDGAGNVYVADDVNDKIRKITPNGTVSTLAGSTPRGDVDGPGNIAQFNNPTDVAVDAAGNVYVTDYKNDRIRKITSSGTVSTLSGSTPGYKDGSADIALFNKPYGLTVDTSNTVYIAGPVNSKIRKITQK